MQENKVIEEIVIQECIFVAIQRENSPPLKADATLDEVLAYEREQDAAARAILPPRPTTLTYADLAKITRLEERIREEREAVVIFRAKFPNAPIVHTLMETIICSRKKSYRFYPA